VTQTTTGRIRGGTKITRGYMAMEYINYTAYRKIPNEGERSKTLLYSPNVYFCIYVFNNIVKFINTKLMLLSVRPPYPTSPVVYSQQFCFSNVEITL